MPESFAALGLTPSATKAEVKARYREMALLAHPDGGGSDQAFQELNQAYALAYSLAEAKVPCVKCQGTGRTYVINGFVSIPVTCPDCRGEG